jgi:hypothetical protein
MSYLRYLCLFVHSGVHHIFGLLYSFNVLCTQYFQFLWIVLSWFPLQLALTFIQDIFAISLTNFDNILLLIIKCASFCNSVAVLYNESV